MMRDAVICTPVRTPVGRFGGVFDEVPVAALAATVLRGLVDRSGLDPSVVEDVVWGQGYANGDAPALGRVAALDAGFPVEVPGIQIDRRCGSGLQAVIDAAMRVQTGVNDVVIAGGAESMSQVEFFATGLRSGVKAAELPLRDRLAVARTTAGGTGYPVEGGMIETAENLREEFAISRLEQDQLAYNSHQRAVSAQKSGAFSAEIVPVEVRSRRETRLVMEDEHPRPETTMESLAALRPIRSGVDPHATVTAGNASGQNDGAAACIVTDPDTALRLGLRPMAWLRGWAVAGVPPRTMGIGPVPATEKVLGRMGLTLADIDLIELNEAFAAQALAVTKSWGIDALTDERFNPNGSGISLGHPIGATGGRILATMLHEMERRQVRYGLETMCIGGGQGLAAVFERWVD
jgi:acetyl-CoA C-acetyltransferase